MHSNDGPVRLPVAISKTIRMDVAGCRPPIDEANWFWLNPAIIGMREHPLMTYPYRA